MTLHLDTCKPLCNPFQYCGNVCLTGAASYKSYEGLVEKEGENLFAFSALGKFNLKNFEAAIPVSNGANIFEAVVGSETGYRHHGLVDLNQPFLYQIGYWKLRTQRGSIE